MSVDLATVARIARLARIGLDPAEAEPLRAELNAILGWVEQLQAVDTTGVEPLLAMTPTARAWRGDVVDDGGKAEAVLANAADATAGFFAVPKVIE